MVAPHYSESRSSLARSMGLGRKASGDGRVETEVPEVESPATEAPTKKSRGRAKAAAA